ncbi:MAG: hypothetical protein ACE5DO_15000 [Desulfobacterales bacterium]
MTNTIKKINKVCKCESCGNEAEMVITCSTEFPDTAEKIESTTDVGDRFATAKQLKGTGICSRCGNEAEIWLEM